MNMLFLIYFLFISLIPFIYPSPLFAQTPTSTLNVLLYNGYGDSGSADYRRSLDYCNEHSLIPGYHFNYSYSGSYLDTADLEGKDVVMYPGGYYNMGYSSYTNQADVRNFVTNGGGYYGTCAGFGAALTCLPSPYACGSGLINLLPPVKAIQNWYQGPLDLRLTDQGAITFGYGGNHLVEVVYGLASFIDPLVTPPPGLTNLQDLAYYDNNHSTDGYVRYNGATPTPWKSQYDYSLSGTQYRDALIANYGQGRVVVQHAHPELGSTWGEQYWYPKWLCAGVAYAAGVNRVLPSYTIGYDRGRYTTYPYTDYLKTAWNPNLSPDNQARFVSTENNFIAHRAQISASGTISAINILHAGDSTQSGQLIAGIYGGDTIPNTLLAQSLSMAISPTPGWQSLHLTTPLHIDKDQTIWLAVAFKGNEYAYYSYLYSSYTLPDSTGSWKRFENRAWGGSLANQDAALPLTLPDTPNTALTHRTNSGTASGGKTFAALNSIYAEVAFDSPAPPPTTPTTNFLDLLNLILHFGNPYTIFNFNALINLL